MAPITATKNEEQRILCYYCALLGLLKGFFARMGNK